MKPARIDVVVPVYRGVDMTRECLESVLAHSGPRLGRVLVVDDRGPDPDMAPMLAALRREAPAVRVLTNEQNLGFIGACNRGLALREGHVVVLNSDTRVTPGWLDELAEVLESDARIAAVSPLSNNATLCSVPRWGEATPAEAVEGRPLGTQALERFTELPTLVGFCMLLRREVLDALGGFDPAYGRGYNEENDWCQRARAAGYRVVRANRALVLHLGEASFVGARAQLDRYNAHRLVARYPAYLEENARFASSLAAHAPALAHRAANGPIRVCLVEGAPERADADVLVAALRAELSGTDGVSLVGELAAADVAFVTGFPGPDALEALLASPVQVVHAPLDLAALEARPPSAPSDAARAAAFALWSSGAVVLPSKEAHRQAEAFFGRPLPSTWVRPWPLPASQPGPGGAAVLVSSWHVTPAELAYLLDGWSRARREDDALRLAVPLDRVPEAWLGLLPGLGVALEAPRALPRLAHGVCGLVVPASEARDGLEARAALEAGLPVSQVEGDPAEAFRTVLTTEGWAAPVAPQAPEWAPFLRRLCAAGAAPFVARERLLELLRAGRRRDSST